MAGIIIPSFPSQDLAKLVLGYLAEEQLMTAYDEFLQASPYLDAHQNEYDRIFMTSLKKILAEYRAVKIYVETCKPFTLRKKLTQCTNLLEVVKYLISNIDNKKITNQDTNISKYSSDKLHTTTATKSDVCEVCSSLRIPNCVCRLKHTEIHAGSTQSMSKTEPSVQESSVETTPLSDLPGNHITTRKKHVKVLEKDVSMSQYNSSSEQQDTSLSKSTSVFKNMSGSSSETMSTAVENSNMPIIATESLESQQKIQEFNDVLKLVCTKNTHSGNVHHDNIERRLPVAGTFQDFSTGMAGSDTSTVIVPDSSTSENINVQVPVTKEASRSTNIGSKKVKRGPKTQYPLNENLDISSHISNITHVDSISGIKLPRIKAKGDKSKVTILSNVKVENEVLTSNLKMPAVLKNATSTPITKMQTILINGTPVYRPTPHPMSSSYTTDEIMAMPTIIITPVSGSPMLTTQRAHYTSSQKLDVAPVSADMVPKSLEPLIIDVSSSVTLSTENTNLHSDSQQHGIGNEAGLIKTVDIVNIDKPLDTNNVKNVETVTSASVPKDNVIPGCAVTSTPEVVPPARKSSSTPRRTSHVRVLDFATPRRILHERIDESVPHQDTVAEVVICKSPSNVSIVNTTGIKTELSALNNTCKEGDKSKTAVKQRKNWDADLRALALANQGDIEYSTPKSQPKSKLKSTKKKKLESSSQNTNTDDKKKSAKKKTKPKKKKSRSPEKTTEDIDSIQESVNSKNKGRTVIKPTINIISCNEKDKICKQETEKAPNKLIGDEHDTPEGDRMTLPNVIGARLNISDLLETPYKQVLYDIQMETPKFLGDLPDDPMSDIKIMNIPTPRFLNSSKGMQATPSSYSSRPTDYSSGGSYYKPDDQDYMPLPEHLGCPELLSKETQNVDSQIHNENELMDNNEKSNKLRSSRPVRQCTKNVSYYNNSNLHNKDKSKEMDESFGETSSFCDSVSSVSEKKTNKENISKISKENIPKSNPKSDKGNKINSTKYKSLVKKDSSKSFMKIRPRRSTPNKSVKNARTKRKSSELSLSLKSKLSPRKRTTSKDRNVNSTLAITTVPTKSRRKSSTPRKLHCTKTFNSESSGHNSPDIAAKDIKTNAPEESHLLCVLDSDTEQLPLRWSDDGSQDVKCKDQETAANDIEDITKIQEYIKTTVPNKTSHDESEGSLHIDLVKRGFDIETAKIIERDLLDTPPCPIQDSTFIPKPVEILETKKQDTLLNKTLESENSLSNNLQIVQDEEPDEEEVEFCNFECNEGSANYFTCQHDETNMLTKTELVKLKDKFCMEVCIDDDVTVRLRATPFNLTVDVEPQNEDVIEYNQKEIEAAVKTITQINTPMKEFRKAQCVEIFDSTLTSIDTPLKATSPKQKETTVTVTEIVLEVEKLDVKEKPDSKKRKRFQSGNTSDESVTDSKKVKPDAQYLFNSANIQNIDIETVLSKLHGP